MLINLFTLFILVCSRFSLPQKTATQMDGCFEKSVLWDYFAVTITLSINARFAVVAITICDDAVAASKSTV